MIVFQVFEGDGPAPSKGIHRGGSATRTMSD